MKKTTRGSHSRQIICWVTPQELARGSRPGFKSRKRGPVPQSEVDAWIKKAKADYRIRSIICLLDQNQLRLYQQLPVGLVSYYRTNGFKVEHIPVRNFVIGEYLACEVSWA